MKTGHPNESAMACPPEGLPIPAVLLQELLRALASIRYGTVELVIHDGRVVQLERTEKVRLEPAVTDR